MITFNGRIVQFGFGAVGKSFFEKVKKEIKFDEYKYYVITKSKEEFEAYVNLGGITTNFVVMDVTKENYQEIFSIYLSEGDLLIDFADSVGTRDFCQWCAENNIMYLNTGETDWTDHWYSIFTEHDKKFALKDIYNHKEDKNRYPIVLQHGNNPGLVSHFVKAGIHYIVRTQSKFKNDRHIKRLLKDNKYNEVAQILGIKMIHVNDIDLQEVKGDFNEDILVSPWCVDSFWFEMLSESTFNVGTHEQIDYNEDSNLYDKDKGYFEFKQLAVDKKCRTYYPNGKFEGYMVPHEETITIAKSLEVKENGKITYRPSVMFLYSPCKYARDFLQKSKGKDGKEIIRGYAYPNNWEILYMEKIDIGTEYVGVLILGDNFNPVWIGNRVECSYLTKDKKSSFWQTPTITPVSMSALAAMCWMLKNKNKVRGGIYFPDDIMDYSYILKIVEKYISKTIYKTFTKEEIEQSLMIDLTNPQTKELMVLD